MQQRLVESQVVNDVASCTDETPSFTVPVVKFEKEYVEKRFLEKAEMERHRSSSKKAISNRKDKAEDEWSSLKI